MNAEMIHFIILIVTFRVAQVHATTLEESLVIPYANILQDNIASNQLNQQINSSVASILANMAAYDLYTRNLTDQILQEYHDSFWRKVSGFKSDVDRVQTRGRSVASGRDVVLRCLLGEGRLEVLADTVNDQVKKCAAVALAEMTNVVSDSLKEAQTFMSVPRVIGKDIQRCGLSASCRWDIVGDAISEAIQIPPKVFALTAKIQSIALRTVVSVDSCGLQGLRQITQTAVSILEDLFLCISNNIIPGATTANNTAGN